VATAAEKRLSLLHRLDCKDSKILVHALGPRFDIRDDDLDSLLDYRASR
jgi:hypothetical protein